MRRSRRGHGGGHEFGGSGEDSFVAVVVTKLTGALLFILLLTMVIMALIPKAEQAAKPSGDSPEPPALAITTPESLPEAIAGRPYAVAMATVGGAGPLRWAVDGELPEGLAFDAEAGILRGTPRVGTPEPVELVMRVSDGATRTARRAHLVVYKPDAPLATPSRWKPGLPPIPWRAWMEQGFGFLVLMMVHLVGMNAVTGLERISPSDSPSRRGRFLAYRWAVRGASLAAMVVLAAWLWRSRAG